MARPNSRVQRAKRTERKIQRISSRQNATLRYVEGLNINRVSEKQRNRALKTRYYYYSKGRDLSRTQSQIRANIIGDDTYVGSLVKKYWDYVNEGLIHHQNGLTVYEQAEFIEGNLSELEMKSAIEQADKWRDATAKREEERRAAFRKSVMDIIPF